MTTATARTVAERRERRHPGIVTGIHRYVGDALLVPIGQPVGCPLHAGELDVAMHGQPEGCRELPVEMVLRGGRDPAHRVQVQIAIQVPVDVIQHPLHPGMVVGKRRFHRPVLRGDAS